MKPAIERAIEAEVRRWCVRLKLAARKAHRPLKQLSVELGYNPSYLPQLLNGVAKLPMHVVFGMLDATGISKAQFFGELYDFADLLPQPGTPEAALFERKLDVPFEAMRLTERLYTKLAEAGISQRGASRRLGEERDYVHSIVSGRVELKAEHVLAILAVAKISPNVFFEEWCGVLGRLAHLADLEEELFPGYTRKAVLSLLFSKVRAAEAALERATPPRPPRKPRGGRKPKSERSAGQAKGG